jgi:hypothetical protein
MEVPVDIISGDSIQDEAIFNYLVEVAKEAGVPASSISIGEVALVPSNGRRLLSRSLLEQVDTGTQPAQMLHILCIIYTYIYIYLFSSHTVKSVVLCSCCDCGGGNIT